jgi:hypothetical protein
MNRLFALLLITLFIASCGGQVEPPKQTTPDTATATAAIDTSEYLPVASLLDEGIRNVETYGAGILKKTKGAKKKDSVFIQYPDFKSIASQFILKELDSTYFSNNYEETSLMDESTKMFNFIYTAKDSIPSLRQVIVYIAPSLTSNKIDRVYMETVELKDNVPVEKKFTWKMGKYCYIITTRQPPSGDPVTSMEKLIWDPEHYADQ